MGDDLKPCPFCGSEHVNLEVIAMQIIELLGADDNVPTGTRVRQAVALASCQTCYARIEDWARLPIPPELLMGFTGKGVPMTTEHIKFTEKLNGIALDLTRSKWNRRA